MKAIPHPSGVPILFDAKWHRYRMGGTSLRSVSKILDAFFPFNEKRALAAVSRKTGESEEAIKAKWNRQALLGKNVHEFIERKLLDQPPPSFSLLIEKVAAKPELLSSVKDILHGEERNYIPVAEKAVETIKEHYDVVAVEQIVACPSLGIGGIIDLLARDKKTGNYLIADWKTSGSIKSNFRFGSFETSSMGCLQHLPNSKMYRYALQIIVYGEILRRERYFESGYFNTHPLKANKVEEFQATQPTTTVGKPKSRKNSRSTDAKQFSNSQISSSVQLDYPSKIEYGIIHFCKDEVGGVCSEFVGISPSTILPRDQPELSFHHMLKQMLEGVP